MVDFDTGCRRLAAALEPFAGQVYFSAECHAEYAALGFGPSPATFAGVAMPDGPAYFCSRGSCLGQVPGEVVAAAFGVFNPAVVVPAVEAGWSKTDAATVSEARTRGALAQLERILGASPAGVERAVELLSLAGSRLRPEGRALYSGVLSLPMPDAALGKAWRLADRLREYRGDAHIAAWTSAGFDATEIGLVTELYWGLPMRTYVRTRAWTDEELDAAHQRLRSRGLIDGEALTSQGSATREDVEVATDLQCSPITAALADDLDQLIDLLEPWGAAIREAGGYPTSGPHDLAAIASA